MACAGLMPRFFSVTFDSLEGVVGKEFPYNDMDEHSHSVFSVFLRMVHVDKFGTGLAYLLLTMRQEYEESRVQII